MRISMSFIMLRNCTKHKLFNIVVALLAQLQGGQ